MEEQFSRDFKGIWIPKEIWLDRTLDFFEKALFAEIHSLDGKDGCYADNKYFMKFFNENERAIQRGLKKLKEYGYISQESFNGRTRVLRSNMKKVYDKFDTSAPQKQNIYDKFDTPGVTDLSPLPPSSAIEPENIYKNIKKRSPNGDPKESPSFTFKRVKMAIEAHQKLVQEFGQEKINEMLERLDEYADINPKRFKEYANHSTVIRKWLRNEPQAKPNQSNILEILKEKCIKQIRSGEIEISNNSVSFKKDHHRLEFLFGDKDFELKIRAQIAKMGINL